MIAGRARARRTISLSAGERGDRKAGGEGSLPRLLDRRPDSLHHFAHELVRVLQHHRIRNAQQSNAEGPQIIFFGGIFAHLVDLRVNAAIEFNGQSMFEAVKIEDAVFDAELTAKFRAQSTIAEQVPRDLFRLRGARSQLANARGGDTHRLIIPAHVPNGG